MSDDRKTDDKVLISINENNLERVHDWVRTADQKAGFTLTITLAMLGLSFASIDPAVNVIVESVKRGQYYWLIVASLTTLFISYLYSGLKAIIHLLEVVKPTTQSTTKRESPLYFGTISEMELDRFQTTMRKYDIRAIIDDLSDQAYVGAMIAKDKFDKLEIVFELITKAIILGLLFIGLSSIMSILLLS